MLRNRVIGILGGIGPESSAIFYHDLIKSIQSNFNINSTADYPKIIINNIAVGDLIDKSISDADIDTILSGLKELDKFMPDFNVIICNSVYSIYSYLQNSIASNILNLADVVEKYLEYHKIKNIGILGTDITVSSLYNYAGINKYFVTIDEQMLINSMIRNINKGKVNGGEEAELKKIIEKLCDKGAEKVLLACTELGLIGKGIEKTIDPMVMLKEEVIERLKKINISHTPVISYLR